MLPIATGVIPFGLVMGSVAATANLSSFEAMGLNVLVFAGAAQLAAVDLMMKDVPCIIVILTGLVINLRMILYSAGLSPYLKSQNIFVRLIGSYCMTDQSYAAVMANEDKFSSQKELLYFYFGASFGMFSTWQLSVALGYVFGNFAPVSWNLDFAVPLGFAALVIPTLKSRNHIYVAILSAMLSVVFYRLPYNLGLLTSALVAIACGAFLTRRKRSAHG